MNEQMSEYRLSKYLDVAPQALQKNEILSTEKFDSTNISIENASITVTNGKSTYKNNVNAPILVRVKR